MRVLKRNRILQAVPVEVAENMCRDASNIHIFLVRRLGRSRRQHCVVGFTMFRLRANEWEG